MTGSNTIPSSLTKNDNRKAKIKLFWERWAVYIFALLFIFIGSWLMLSKHNAFNTRTYDFARFSQAIWNVLHGEPLYTSISHNNILGNHFSPILALYAPLLLIWPDERVLLIGQVVMMALTGLILAKIVADKYPALAPLFLLAFYLNPYVHEVTLFEFRRIVPAAPFIALTALAVYKKKYWLMLFSLLMVLLAKEDMGLIVSAFGVYLLVFKKEWKWGLPLLIGGIGWTVIASLWVIPAIGRPGNEEKLYPQLFYFDYLGSNYEEIGATLRSDPLILLRYAFQPSHFTALLKFLLPLGFILPFLSPAFALMILPVLGYLMISNDPDMYLLEKWYTAPMLPILYAAVAMGMTKLSYRHAKWVVGILLVGSTIGFFMSSPAPGGGRFDAALYDVTDHDKVALALVDEVPQDAIVAAQVPIVPHLSLQKDIYHYPWTTKMPLDQIEYFVLDRTVFSHPYTDEEINTIMTDMVADPNYVVTLEGDGIYLIKQNGEPQPSFVVNDVADGTIKLAAYDLAVRDEAGLYRTVTDDTLALKPGDEIRVNLYWEAINAPDAERTVSVRIAGENGRLLAQQDNWPVQNHKPTSGWQSGLEIRDTYYLTIDPTAEPGLANLDVLLYDSYTQESIPFATGGESLHLHPIHITQNQ